LLVEEMVKCQAFKFGCYSTLNLLNDIV